jgi:hypothetical protein
VSRDSAALLGVVVDELLDVGLDELDLGEDLVGGGGPGERCGAGVPVRVQAPLLTPSPARGPTRDGEGTLAQGLTVRSVSPTNDATVRNISSMTCAIDQVSVLRQGAAPA